MAQFEPNYGKGLACTTDLDPMLRFVSGTTLMANACVRRLFCRKGSLLSDALYGIDLRDLLGSKFLTQKDVDKIASFAQAELLNDERIASVSVTGTFNSRTRTLNLTIVGTGALGPFSLTLAVSDVTVQILQPT